MSVCLQSRGSAAHDVRGVGEFVERWKREHYRHRRQDRLPVGRHVHLHEMNWLEPFRRNARPMTGPAKQSRQHIQHWIASSLTLIAAMTRVYQFTPRKSRLPISTPLWRRMSCAVAAWK